MARIVKIILKSSNLINIFKQQIVFFLTCKITLFNKLSVSIDFWNAEKENIKNFLSSSNFKKVYFQLLD